MGHSDLVQTPTALHQDLGKMLASFPSDFPVDLRNPIRIAKGKAQGILEKIDRPGTNRSRIALHRSLNRRDHPFGDPDFHLDFHGVDVVLQDPPQTEQVLFQKFTGYLHGSAKSDHELKLLKRKVEN